MRTSRLVAAAAAALLLAGCSAQASPSGSSTGSANAPDGLVASGKFTLCIDPEYAPLEYYENGSSGNIVGFDADAARALAKHWGVDAKFEVSAFDGLMPALQAKRCDAIFGGLYMTQTRLGVADASALMKTGPSIITSPARQKDFTKATDLCGVAVAAQSASANAAKIKSLATDCQAAGKDAPKLTEYPKTAETVLAVINGKADALIETDVAAAYMASQNEGKLVVAPGVFAPDTTFGVFSRKGDKISAAIADGIKALRADGTLAKLAGQYKLDASTVTVN